MYWNRYIVAKGMVVQDVDGKKEDDVDEPAPNRDTVRPEEERRS